MSRDEREARSRRAYPEPSLDELLGDPMMPMLLQRDGTDETTLRALLRRTAQNLYGTKAAETASA